MGGNVARVRRATSTATALPLARRYVVAISVSMTVVRYTFCNGPLIIIGIKNVAPSCNDGAKTALPFDLALPCTDTRRSQMALIMCTWRQCRAV